MSLTKRYFPMSRDVTLREFFLKSNKPMRQIPLLNLHQIKAKVDVRIWSLQSSEYGLEMDWGD